MPRALAPTTRGLTLLTVGAAAACDPAASVARGTSALAASPAVVACAAGERVRVAVGGGGGAPLDFALANDRVALADVDRVRGTASVVCAAMGTSVIAVSAAGATLAVPVTVRAAAPGAIALSLAPGALAMTNGTTSWVTASVTSSLPDASTDARYASSDTTIVAVDSITGQVRATGRGQATVVARARADTTVHRDATVTVTPGSVIVASLAVSTPPLSLIVGDSARVVATVFLNGTAPPTTSRALTFMPIDSQIVRVSPTGAVRALRAGNTAIYVAPVAAPLIRAVVTVFVFEPVP